MRLQPFERSEYVAYREMRKQHQDEPRLCGRHSYYKLAGSFRKSGASYSDGKITRISFQDDRNGCAGY